MPVSLQSSFIGAVAGFAGSAFIAPGFLALMAIATSLMTCPLFIFAAMHMRSLENNQEWLQRLKAVQGEERAEQILNNMRIIPREAGNLVYFLGGVAGGAIIALSL